MLYFKYKFSNFLVNSYQFCFCAISPKRICDALAADRGGGSCSSHTSFTGSSEDPVHLSSKNLLEQNCNYPVLTFLYPLSPPKSAAGEMSFFSKTG